MVCRKLEFWFGFIHYLFNYLWEENKKKCILIMNDIQHNFQEEEGIDIKKWIRKILANWYWFAICGFIGLVFGYGYSRISQEEYELKSLILAEKNETSGGMNDLFSSQLFGTKTNLSIEKAPRS